MAFLEAEIDDLRARGLFRRLRVVQSEQRSRCTIDGREVITLSSNNYLGLTTHPRLRAAAIDAVERFGAGSGAVRTIAGTMSLHEQLEERLAAFKQTETTLTFQSGFTANTGAIPILAPDGAVIVSDALNHASIIDGIRLCKAERHRYPNGDMAELERLLSETREARLRLVATDGVFSMDGTLARLDAICDLAERYGAMVMVDDSHATGFVGKTGRGTPEHCGVMGRVDIITSTLGKALGGAAGGFSTGRQEIVDLLRQRSRPYLFSNTLAPAVAGASLAVLELLERATELRDRLMDGTAYFRSRMAEAGFRIPAGIHPIVPILLGDARLAHDFADAMLAEGIYVIGFSYPVVPKGEARIRVQLSAAHTRPQIDRALDAFTRIGRQLRVLPS
jgi:glycine C-acetyltransferase